MKENGRSRASENCQRLGPKTIQSDLVPALKVFKEELLEKGVTPLLWFIFGSGVKGNFRPKSDIDIGLVVRDEEYETELELGSSSLAKRFIAGHRVEVTRFSTSWLEEKEQTAEVLREKVITLLWPYTDIRDWISMSNKEIKIGRDLPAPEGEYHIFTAVYIPTNSTVYISEDDPERMLDSQARAKVKAELKKIGKLEKYGEFLLVARLAEEFAHFVQHTRGQLPNVDSSSVQFSDSNKVKVTSYGVEFDHQKEDLVQIIMERTFKEMDYTGLPPLEGVIIVDGPIRFDYTNEYLEGSHDEKRHYSDKYPFEQEARKVQSSVLVWWFREREEMPFGFILGKSQ